MTPMLFVSSLVVLLVIFFLRDKTSNIINDKLNLSFKFQSEWIVYLVSILLIITISLGMLLDTQTEGALSKGFSSMEPSAKQRPNPLFDINTYW